jgi:hypothetical protein
LSSRSWSSVHPVEGALEGEALKADAELVAVQGGASEDRVDGVHGGAVRGQKVGAGVEAFLDGGDEAWGDASCAEVGRDVPDAEEVAAFGIDGGLDDVPEVGVRGGGDRGAIQEALEFSTTYLLSIRTTVGTQAILARWRRAVVSARWAFWEEP